MSNHTCIVCIVLLYTLNYSIYHTIPFFMTFDDFSFQHTIHVFQSLQWFLGFRELIITMWTAQEVLDWQCTSRMTVICASGAKIWRLRTWNSWVVLTSLFSLLWKLYVIYFGSLSACSLSYPTTPTRYISLEYCTNVIRSLTDLSTFLWLTVSCWRWWHPFCLLGENRWAALAEKCHTECKYSTLLFPCLRLFWLFLLFPSALKERTPHWWMMTIMVMHRDHTDWRQTGICFLSLE